MFIHTQADGPLFVFYTHVNGFIHLECIFNVKGEMFLGSMYVYLYQDLQKA